MDTFRIIKNGRKDVLINMIYDYILELSNIDSKVKVRDKEELNEEYFGDDISTFYTAYEGDVPVGFCIMQKVYFNNSEYIDEFYIVPDFRRKGYGFRLASKIMSSRRGKVFFSVIKSNTVAKSFWKKVFKNWKDTSNDNVKVGRTDYLDWYYYERI